MRVYLIRHGETVWNRENRTQGWTDIELNAAGRRHAATIGLALREAPLDAVYASDLARAMATAQAIASHHALDVIPDPDLRELNQGLLDGLTMQELRDGHAALLEEWRARASTLCMPEGESMTDLQRRAWQAIQRIVAAHPRGTVAVVSHNLAIVAVLCRVMGLDLDSFRRIRQDVAAINVLEFDGPMGPHVVRMNDTGHVALGKRLSGMMAGLRDAASFEPVPVGADDLAELLAAGQVAVESGDVRAIAIAGEQLARIKEIGRAHAGDRSSDALQGAPALIAVLAQDGSVAGVEAMVLSLRIGARALGYATARLAEGLVQYPAILSAVRAESPWCVMALLGVGLDRL